KKVITLSYASTENTKYRIIHDGSFLFEDGIIYKKGSLGFNQYSIEEWNGYVDSLWKKKLLVNEK
ncbi:MAG: hypothetical protein IPO37_04930, partial [Saprospiraceae bacterium]|nr:hypothetical protein [Saprospiraceae bacterium]